MNKKNEVTIKKMSESNLDNAENLNDKTLNEYIQKEDVQLEENQDEEEIEFDDNIDIEALQAQLQQHMSEGGIDYVPDTSNEQSVVLDASNEMTHVEEFEDNNVDREENPQELENFVQALTDNSSGEVEENQNNQETENIDLPALFSQEEKPKLQLGEKKYIIYIEPDNVNFIEAMTINERKSIINRLLKEEDATLKKRKILRERAKFINQVIIMVITVVISLPIFFVLLNKSIEVTILNYQQSQQNFVKLYKEQGKIKSYKKFQKTFD